MYKNIIIIPYSKTNLPFIIDSKLILIIPYSNNLNNIIYLIPLIWQCNFIFVLRYLSVRSFLCKKLC